MKVQVRYRQIESTPALQELVERRVQFGLSRFVHTIREVHVTLADVNGPRGGVDKVCRVRVAGPKIDPIVIEEAAAGLATAIDGAIARAARTTARTIDRRRPLAAIA